MKDISVQLYSFKGTDYYQSPQQAIRMAGSLGYTGVELIRDYTDVPAEEMLAVAKEAGVKIVSAHVGIQFIPNDLPYLKQLGVKCIICPHYTFATKEEALILAAELNCVGKIAAPYGIKVGYHNHTNEFAMDDGKHLLDYVIENTNPEHVCFQLDCGWCSAAGVDPVEYINKYAGRFAAVHVKENNAVVGPGEPTSKYDMTPAPVYPKDENGKPILPPEVIAAREERDKLNCATGAGIVDWKAVKAAADAQCPDVLYIVEREANYDNLDRAVCLKADCDWIKANL